jgi:membrane protease YdiL (CAAX protease family)
VFLPALLLRCVVSAGLAFAERAVAEELLFRGLLLTAVQQRLGNTDAVAVVAALFALIHLDLQQFFLYCVLGGACGLLTVRSGSVWPAVVLHAAFNGTAVAAGLLLHR